MKARIIKIGIILGLMTLIHLLAGCAARRPVGVVTVPRDCITQVKLTPHTYCAGPDSRHLNCVGIQLTKVCEKLEVGK